MDTQPDIICDMVTDLACRLFKTEIALVSLVDENRQWFKSRRGLQANGTPRSQSFCSYAIEQSDVMVVLDATQDTRFFDNPLVTGDPHIRFYAGASLCTREGVCLGTLCLIGKSPRERFDQADASTLEHLAAIVMARLETLRVESYIDTLTSLPNRHRLLEDLSALRLPRHSRQMPSDELTAVVIDVCGRNYLAGMIKALGWDYAEGFIIEAKERLGRILKNKALYRIGTHSFSYLEHDSLVTEQVKEIEEGFAITMEHHGIPHHLEIAVGIVPVSQCEDNDDLLSSLVTSVDVARETGVTSCRYHQPMGHSQRHSFELLSSLPGALLSGDEMWLEFQPKVALATGACSGMEALLRWRHPLHGMVSPASFIPLLEKTALIRQVTAWVLQRGIEQAAAWMRRGEFIPVAINVSARDFDNDEMLRTLAAELELHRIPPGLIEVEFTESAMSRRPERLSDMIREIRKLGVKVSIDDFGSGFSNLNYLKKVPADFLKIDQSFVRQLETNYSDQHIVPSMIHLGHKLGFKIVAEGIESDSCLQLLRDYGCDYGQGFGIACPMLPADAWDWLRARQ